MPKFALALTGLLALCCAPSAPSAASAAAVRSGRVTSNVLRQDYAGSATCSECHAREATAFASSPMHRMTRDVHKTQIHAAFAGEQLELGGDSARLFQRGGERELELVKRDGRHTLFRVTKVIGGRYREDFVGIELDSDGAPRQKSEERILPVSYLVFDQSLRYKGYSVLVSERKGLEAGAVWRQTCIFCHNTPPQIMGLLDEIYGPGFPSYQGSASDDAPPDRRFGYHISDEPRLRSALADELARLGAKARASDTHELLDETMLQTRARFDERDLVELGIGCEACHGGSREHVAAPRTVKPSFALESNFMEVSAPGQKPFTRALQINRTCAKCHTVLFSHYPYTWEGGQRRNNPGGSSINSGEARDFLLGACTSQLYCTQCHDPHGEDTRADLDALAGPKGDALCTSCHGEFAGAEAQRAHTHHAPDNAGSHCLSCHMPRKNMGLAYQLTRYHRIGSPSDRERVEHDRPLECALCHADKSVEQIVSTMERWWQKSYSREDLRRLYGADLAVDPIRATLVSGLPHEQAVAARVAAEHARRELLPLVADVMKNEYPLVRYFAKKSANELSGKPLPLDPAAPRSEIAESLAHLFGAASTDSD